MHRGEGSERSRLDGELMTAQCEEGEKQIAREMGLSRGWFKRCISMSIITVMIMITTLGDEHPYRTFRILC